MKGPPTSRASVLPETTRLRRQGLGSVVTAEVCVGPTFRPVRGTALCGTRSSNGGDLLGCRKILEGGPERDGRCRYQCNPYVMKSSYLKTNTKNSRIRSMSGDLGRSLSRIRDRGREGWDVTGNSHPCPADGERSQGPQDVRLVPFLFDRPL